MSKSRVLSGVRWTLTTTLLRRVVTLLLFYFVAKWLSREDLGVFREYSLILALVAAAGSFSLDYLYVIEKRLSLTALTALAQLSLLASVVLIPVLALLSGWLGRFYHSPQLGNLLLWTSVFLGVEILRRGVRALASARLQFRELALAETANVILYSVLSVVLLYYRRSVVVFVSAFYLGNLLELVWLYRLNLPLWNRVGKRLKRLGIMVRYIKSQSGFLSRATLVSVVNLFSGNAPILILGAMLNPLSIGLYYFAAQLIGIPVGMFTGALGQVFFPVFAGRKDAEIESALNRYLRLTGAVGLPLLLLFTFAAMYLTLWLFGEKWSCAVPLLPAMFILFGTGFYVNPLGGIPFIRRKPGWELIWNAVSLALKTGAMLWGLQTSFTMAVWAYSLTGAACNLAFYLMALYLVGADPRKVSPKLALSLLPSLVLGLGFYLLEPWGAYVSLGLSLLLAVVIFLSADLLSRGQLRRDLLQLFTD